jgi:hypothetical protein
MADSNEFYSVFLEALQNKRQWLEKSELPKLKLEFRTFYISFRSLFKVLVKKGLVNEDPYKDENTVTELEPLPESAINDNNELGIRLSAYDNQLDYLINFYEYNTANFSQEKVKKVLALVKYIDWANLSTESGSYNTAAVAEVINQMRKGDVDVVSAKLLVDSLGTLGKASGKIIAILKGINDFNREDYKRVLRDKITNNMTGAEATLQNMKKRFAQAAPGKPFFTELAEEVINEDFSERSDVLHKKALERLGTPDEKSKPIKGPTSLKSTLISGLNDVGLSAASFLEIIGKISESHSLIQNRKRSFWENLMRLLGQMFNKQEESVVYECEYREPGKGPVKESIEFETFCDNLEKKIKILNAIGPRGPAASKLEAMKEEQLLELLGKNIRDVQGLYKSLSALDDFFKGSAAAKEDGMKVKGIKPELGSIKNAYVKAIEKLREYQAQMEEAEQFKKMGIDTVRGNTGAKGGENDVNHEK